MGCIFRIWLQARDIGKADENGLEGATVCPLSLRTAKFLGWRIMRSMPVFVGWNRLGR